MTTLSESTDLTILKSQFITYFDVIQSDGEIIGEFLTKYGIVDFLADIELLEKRTILHVKDVIIYPRSQTALKGLISREMFKLRSEIIDAARQLGFKGIRITGQRAEHSTSANPGHSVDIFIRFQKEKGTHASRDTEYR